MVCKNSNKKDYDFVQVKEHVKPSPLSDYMCNAQFFFLFCINIDVKIRRGISVAYLLSKSYY